MRDQRNGHQRRVVHIIDGLATGGAEHLLLTAARTAQSQRWDLHVLSLGSPSRSDVVTRLQGLGVTPRFVESTKSRQLTDSGRLARLRRAVKELDPDIVHTHLRYSNILGPLACTGLRAARVTTLHTIAGSDLAPPRDRLERSALRHGFHARIAVGPTVGMSQQQRLGREVVVVPNPVDLMNQPDPLAVADRRARLLEGAPGPLILTAGRLTEAKGLPDLLRAFALLRWYFPGAVLAVAGAGPLLEQLRLLAEELRVAGHVRFLGDRTDVPTLLRAADVFALASVHEGLPLVLLEAMAAGQPIVATDVGDVAFALDGSGVLVPPGKHCQLASGIVHVLSDPCLARRLGDQARATVQARHAPSTWATTVDDVYSSLERQHHG